MRKKNPNPPSSSYITSFRREMYTWNTHSRNYSTSTHWDYCNSSFLSTHHHNSISISITALYEKSHGILYQIKPAGIEIKIEMMTVKVKTKVKFNSAQLTIGIRIMIRIAIRRLVAARAVVARAPVIALFIYSFNHSTSFTIGRGARVGGWKEKMRRGGKGEDREEPTSLFVPLDFTVYPFPVFPPLSLLLA